MPFYEYLCPKCTTKFDLMRAIADRDQPATCPECGHKTAARQLPHIQAAVKDGPACPKGASGGFS
jgi:putative FmdB family regulatory protein